MNCSGRLTTPPCSPNQRNNLVDRGLDLYLDARKSRSALKWGSINVALLSVLLFDISNQCPFAVSKWYYLEYAIAAVIALSVVFHFGRYFYIFFSLEPVQGTDEQRRLMQFEANGEDCGFFCTVNNWLVFFIILYLQINLLSLHRRMPIRSMMVAPPSLMCPIWVGIRLSTIVSLKFKAIKKNNATYLCSEPKLRLLALPTGITPIPCIPVAAQ